MNSTSVRGRATTARVGVSVTFFVMGAVFGNWVARIPDIQSALGLSNGELGVSLLGSPIGSVLAAPLAGAVIQRIGSRALVRVAGVAYCLALPLLAVAPGQAWLMAALFALGISAVSLDVAMNAQGAEVEVRYGKPIMSSFHGLFSVGGLVGAATGGAVASTGIAPLPHFAVAGASLCVIVLLASVLLLSEVESEAGGGPLFSLPTPSLAGLCLIAFCALLSEGAIGDWSAVYLRRDLGTGAGLAASGYAVFSMTMAGGRLIGDKVNELIGPVALVRLSGALTVLGMVIGLLAEGPAAAIVGFAFVGAGLATVFPVMVSAASRDGSMPSSSAIAAVTSAGYSAFLVGPPLIGFASEIVTLRGALGVIAVLGLMVALLSRSARRARPDSLDD